MTENRTPSFLLVEDDEVDREAMLRGFSTAKVPGTLTVANDGLEALDILREWQIRGAKKDRAWSSPT